MGKTRSAPLQVLHANPAASRFPCSLPISRTQRKNSLLLKVQYVVCKTEQMSCWGIEQSLEPSTRGNCSHIEVYAAQIRSIGLRAQDDIPASNFW